MFFSFGFLLSFLPFSLQDSWNCKHLMCAVSGKSNDRIEIDYQPVRSWEKEAPYLATLYESDKIFCLGILINLERVLTVASCLYKDGFVRRTRESIKIRVGSLKIGEGETRQAESFVINPRCDKETKKLLRKSCDFAVIKVQSPFTDANLRTAPFKSKNPDAILSDIQFYEFYNCPQNENCKCAAFSFGTHNVWREKRDGDGKWEWIREQDGTQSPHLMFYGVNLLHINSCNNWNGKCCVRTIHEQWLADKLYGRNTVRCASRYNPSARCMGETGSPIVCGFNVIGLIKGNNFCPLRSKDNYHGEIIYVGMDHGIEFVKEHYKHNLEAFPAGPDTGQIKGSNVKPPDSQDNATMAEYENYYSNFPYHGPTFVVQFLSLILLTIIFI